MRRSLGNMREWSRLRGKIDFKSIAENMKERMRTQSSKLILIVSREEARRIWEWARVQGKVWTRGGTVTLDADGLTLNSPASYIEWKEE